MSPWVGPHAPSFARQLWGLPSRVDYLSTQGVLRPLFYGTTASPLLLELRGLSDWQATPSRTVYRLACQRLLSWLRVTFAVVPDAAWPGSDQWPWGTVPAAGPVGRLGRSSAPDRWGVGSFLSLGRPTCARVCGVPGHLAPVYRCARLVPCFARAVSWANWLLFTDVPAWFVVFRLRCPGPLGSCSALCPLGALFRLWCVLGHLAPVHRCARSVPCFACAVSWANWLLFTGVPAWFVVSRVQCPGPLRSCSGVCLLGVVFFLCGVRGHLAPVHRCARSVLRLRVRCPGQLGSCSPLCPRGLLCRVCDVLGALAPIHRCAPWARCFACAVSCATWLLFTAVLARCVVLCVRCSGTLGCCSPVCLLGALLCVCGVLGHLTPVHRSARVVCCVPFAVFWATWLLFTGVPARCVALCVRCPGPLGSCSPVCALSALLCVCGVLGHLAPVHRCARSVRCFVCAVSWATWLLFTGVLPGCVVLLVRCPGPLGSCSPVCPLRALPVCAVY